MSNSLNRHLESRMAMRKKKLVKRILDSAPNKTNKNGNMTGMHKSTSFDEKERRHIRNQKYITDRVIKEIRDIESGRQSWNFSYNNT
jgi:hypothetical protein